MRSDRTRGAIRTFFSNLEVSSVLGRRQSDRPEELGLALLDHGGPPLRDGGHGGDLRKAEDKEQLLLSALPVPPPTIERVGLCTK